MSYSTRIQRLRRELAMITTRVHGAGPVEVDVLRGVITLNGSTVASIPRTTKGTPVFATTSRFGSVTERVLYELSSVLEKQAADRGTSIDDVRFKCTSAS